MCSITMIFQGQFNPYLLRKQNRVEISNECLTLISTYTLFVFTQFVPEPEARYKIGWALVGVVSISLASNILIIFHESAVSSIRRLRMKYQRRKYNAKMKTQ